MTIAEILAEAADRIDVAPKLAKGVYSAYANELDDAGNDISLLREQQAGGLCYCAVGAIIHTSQWPDIDEAIEALVKHLNLSYGEAGESAENAVYAWNDAPGRTKDEVVAALRGAAAGLEKF